MEGGGGKIGGMIPTVGKRTVRFSPVILFKIAYDSPEDLFFRLADEVLSFYDAKWELLIAINI